MKRIPTEADWLAAINGLGSAARTALARLNDLEQIYRRGLRAVACEYRPGALPSLLALLLMRPMVSPQTVADMLQFSVAGASKLIQRAVAAGMLVEITKRKTWKAFLPPDLAVHFGFASPRRGRPRLDPPALPADRNMAAALDAFDTEMAAIDRLLSSRSNAGGA
ncbi:MAG: hypothetical protein QHC67_18185 [Sphingobium sp.]|uniref:hypothetical protein n=1 Tax=Sphingobium sp. TaxID=1912891 RepID=UPI0029ACC6C0|nr:hypothetical protein [Sphingobium sp.]MDX3911706.1 hypothetical protein [Sphingobium sp.]